MPSESIRPGSPEKRRASDGLMILGGLAVGAGIAGIEQGNRLPDAIIAVVLGGGSLVVGAISRFHYRQQG